uniref:ribosomal protein L20 n=1 Tax=Sahlingia subintegra TaxID=468936 RepID=UPI001FCDE4C0|nr:ribosomal protein L20 [Sahlingia subintegra]UNJ19080.1 ribosomal protein L20 [Sahlingia subintegra]
MKSIIRKHLKDKRLRYSTLNRYYKKRDYKKKALHVISVATHFNCLMLPTTFLKEKLIKNIFLNKKTLKMLVLSEPLSFSLLGLVSI